MTAQWTIDDDGDLSYDKGRLILTDWDDERDATAHLPPDALAALVAVVRAARLVDDMATALTEALDAFEECTGDYAKELCADDLARWHEVAALHHARQQEAT